MSENPFFSIIIPSFNRAGFLPELIQTIQHQSFSNFEIILVDDGSSDNTAEIVKTIQKYERRVRYIYQINSERGAARNNGIRQALGNFILFIDSDDVMLPNYLGDLKSLIETHSNYNYYAGKFVFNSSGKIVASDIQKFTGEVDLNLILKGNPFACNFCVKKDNPSLRLFNEDRYLSTMEDWMFLVENLQNDKIFIGDFVGLHMMQHEGRSMNQNQLLISRRINATEYLVKKIPFSKSQRKTIWAYSYSFCAIHQYLDYKKKLSLKFIILAIKKEGINTYFLKLFIKFFIGRSGILRIKKYLLKGS